MLSCLAQRVLQEIRKRELMRAGNRVAIAVSGGADSVALLRLMLELRSELGVVLSIAHFNHRIRGQASDEDEAFVRELAATHGLDFHRDESNVPAHAKQYRLSLETAARECRYDFFRRLIVSGHCTKVATAHTLDDQAETVLMRIIRGTGISGLAAIQPQIELPNDDQMNAGEVIRPLLGVPRVELEAYLASLHQPWREDATNADLHHTRNRVRHLVIPLLEREFNPAIRDRLAELTDIAQEEERYWSEHVRELRNSGLFEFEVENAKLWLDSNLSTSAQPGRDSASAAPFVFPVSIHLPKFLELSVAEQRRVVRCVTKHMSTLTFEDIGRILQLARDELHGELELPAGLKAWRERQVLKIGSRPRYAGDVEVEYEFPISLPLIATQVFRAGGTRLRLSTGDRWNAAAIALSKLPAPQLVLRPWRPGDRFWPQHSSGPKKVKELLTDKHINGPERQLWPVIACRDDIVWLRSFGVSQQFVAGEGAKDAIVITEQGTGIRDPGTKPCDS